VRVVRGNEDELNHEATKGTKRFSDAFRRTAHQHLKIGFQLLFHLLWHSKAAREAEHRFVTFLTSWFNLFSTRRESTEKSVFFEPHPLKDSGFSLLF
jgi:hypothetical protein